MPRRAKGSSSGSPPLAEQLELELVAPQDGASGAPGLWRQVEELPARVARYHRERRKLVNPRLHQADLLGAQTEPVDSGVAPQD